MMPPDITMKFEIGTLYKVKRDCHVQKKVQNDYYTECKLSEGAILILIDKYFSEDEGGYWAKIFYYQNSIIEDSTPTLERPDLYFEEILIED